MGLAIAVLGLTVNGWFWRRYALLTREQYSAVIAAQQQLYRAKTSVDLCVVIALAAVAIAPDHPATHYVDILGSVTVAGLLVVEWDADGRTASSRHAGVGPRLTETGRLGFRPVSSSGSLSLIVTPPGLALGAVGLEVVEV